MDSSAPHLGFVAASYGIVALVVVGLFVVLLADHGRLKRRIGELEARGAARREPPR